MICNLLRTASCAHVDIRQFVLIIIIISLLWTNSETKKTHCLSIPTLPAKVDFYIKSCQSEIKSNIIDDLVYATLHDHSYKNPNNFDLLHKHIEFLSKNQHHHLDGFEYFHDAHSHKIPNFANQHSFKYHHHHGHPNIFSLHEYAVDPDYSTYLDSQFKAAFPHVSEEIISEQQYEIKKEKVIEAHEELTNILANHKVVERDVQNKLQKNFRNASYSSSKPIKRRHKRSLLDILNGSRWSNKPKPVEIPIAATPTLHPVLLSNEDRWLAGCLMQCIFQKTNSVDKYGYPTLDGLVDLYTSGINDQIYFIYTLRAVNKCLKLVSFKHHVHRGKYPHKSETCDIAFDIFDCISDSIAFYCNS